MQMRRLYRYFFRLMLNLSQIESVLIEYLAKTVKYGGFTHFTVLIQNDVFSYNQLNRIRYSKRVMSGIVSAFSIPIELNFTLDKDHSKRDNESDFQSNYVEDQEEMFQQKFKKQKKTTFNSLIWNEDDQRKLIELHKRIGNKWTSLSRYFAGSCENSIKNHFYSRLRKSIRKLNKNLGTLFGKKYAKFNLNIIFKISNASEGKVIGKCQVDMSIQQFYKDFIYKLIDFSDKEQENDSQQKVDIIQQVQDFTLGLVGLENLFRIVSGQRVYKGKKKNIAYLKRFNFKLDSDGKKTLVISKENCYITDGPVSYDSQSENNSDNCISINDIEVEGLSESQQMMRGVKLGFHQAKTQQSLMSILPTPGCDSYISSVETQSPTSPYQSCFLDDQLKQYQITIALDKGKWYDNLLDQYSGNKFHFDIGL